MIIYLKKCKLLLILLLKRFVFAFLGWAEGVEHVKACFYFFRSGFVNWGDPAGILIPHILCMFIMMMLSTRTGLEYFSNTPKYKIYTFLTLAFVITGGMILGPITQKFAFGEYWTGIPYGHDLTDNKTLIALIAWIAGLWGVYKSKHPGRWILAAAIATLIIFLIPHSVLGSEIDYRKN